MAQVDIKIVKTDNEANTYNKAWLDSIESTSQCTSDPATIEYGVIANTGSIKLRDLNGQIRKDIESGVLPVSNVETAISVNGNQVQAHLMNDSDYVESDQTLSLSLTNKLSLLDNMQFNGLQFSKNPLSAYNILSYVFKSLNGYNNVLTDSELFATYAPGLEQITVNGNTADSTSSLTTNTAQYNDDHKYYISFQCKCERSTTKVEDDEGNSDYYTPTRAGIFFPLAIGTGVNAVETQEGELSSSEYTRVDGFTQFHFGGSGDNFHASLYFDNNKTDAKCYFKDILVYDMTANGVEDKDIEWCRKHLHTQYRVDNILANVKSRLDEIIVQNPYMESSTFRVAFNKVCQIAQLYIYLDEDDEWKVSCANVDDENIRNSTANILSVPTSHKISNLNKSIVLKNKYDGIKMSETNVVRAEHIDTLIHNEDLIPTNVSWLTGTNDLREASQATSTPSLSAGFLTMYSTFDITIPKYNDLRTEEKTSVLSGVDKNDHPYISYEVEWDYEYGIFENGSPFEVLYKESDTGNIADATAYKEESHEESTIVFKGLSFSITDLGVKYIDLTIDDESNTISDAELFADEGDYYSGQIRILTGKTLCYSIGTSDLSNGNYARFTPKRVIMSFNGNKVEYTFSDIDASTDNITKAKNPVSLEHNELLQNTATWGGEKLSTVIKNNVLSDYVNGVPTGDIDLFCQDLQGTITSKDWAKGEIINVDDLLTFQDDTDGTVWRTTGRTFKYDGAPTVSLELRKCKHWHTIWNGSLTPISNNAVSVNITVELPVSIDKTKPYAISGVAVFGGTSNPKTQQFNTGEVPFFITTGYSPLRFVTAYFKETDSNSQIQVVCDYESHTSLGLSYSGYLQSLTITKIEQYY